MNLRHFPLLATAFFVCGTIYSAAAQVSRAELRLKETVVGQISSGAELVTAHMAKEHFAWIEKQSGKKTAHLDGKQFGGAYEDARYLHFNPDATRLAFAAKRSGKWVLVVDGKESREFVDDLSLTWNPKTASYAYAGCSEKHKCALFVDDKQLGGTFDEISYCQYSPDGKHIAVVGKKKKRWMVAIDGSETGPEMEDVDFRYFGYSDQRWYVAGVIGNKWMYVVDGVAGPAFDTISPIVFSENSSHFTYAGAGADYAIVKKNRTSGSLVLDGSVVQHGEGAGFGGGVSGLFQTQMLRTGIVDFFAHVHGFSDSQFDQAGKLIYARYQGEDSVVVFIDEKHGPSFSEVVSSIITTADGKHFAYVGLRGGQFIEVRDNVPGKSFDAGRRVAFVPWIQISPDAAHLAYELVLGGAQFEAGRTAKALRRVMIDGEAGPEYDALSLQPLVFQEGNHYGYEIVGADGKKDRVLIDGRESRLFDGVVINTLKVDSKGRAEFYAIDNNKFLKVESE
jgi:hypothetical protein